MRRWLDLLAGKFPDWEPGQLEGIAMDALANFYAFFDRWGDVEPWDLLRFMLASEWSPGGFSVRHIMRILGTLRLALSELMEERDRVEADAVHEALDSWQELVLERYETTILRQSRVHRIEIAQRMADLNALNHCAATLNASLDLNAALHAAAHLGRDLANVDVMAVYFLERGEFFLKSCAFSEQAAHLSVRESAGSGVQVGDSVISYDLRNTVVIDARRQDMPIAVSRIGTGIAQIQAIICVPLHAGEEWIGRVTAAYLEPQEFPAQKIRMIEIFANHAGQAIFNAMHYEQRADMAVAQERQRIACEMHDTMLQTLVSMNINLRVAIRHARQGDWEQALQVFEQARHLGKVAVQEGRDTLNNLREAPSCMSKSENLALLIQSAAAAFSAQSGLVPVVEVNESIDLPALVAHQLYRLVGEALTNIYRHARATMVAIQTGMTDDELWLRVVDNGVGFDPVRANVRGSFGLSGMRERARLINAQLTIDSAPGKGTTVDIRWAWPRPASRIQIFSDSDAGFYGQAQRTDSDIVNTNEDGVAWLRVGR